MSIKYIVRIAASTFAAVSAVKTFSRARQEGDKLEMFDAALRAASVAVAVAVVVREVRDGEDNSHVVELGRGD